MPHPDTRLVWFITGTSTGIGRTLAVKAAEVGHQVVLSAGIFGTVRALHDGKVDLEIAPGTVITVARQVVVRRADELESRPQAAAGDPVQDPATSDEPDARPQGDARTED